MTDAQRAQLDPTGVIAEIVTDLGGDPSNAPAEALVRGDADLCGFDVILPSDDGGDPFARQCFVNGPADNDERVLVQSLPGPNGQIIHVYRFDPALAAVTDYSDEDGWAGRVCANIVAEPDRGPDQFSLANCTPL